MALLLADSFDFYDNNDDMPLAGPWSSATGVTFTSDTLYGTGKAVVFADGSMLEGDFDTYADVIFTAFTAFFEDLALGEQPDGFFLTFLDGAVEQCTIQFSMDGNIYVRTGDTTGAVVATFENAFALRQFKHWQIKLVIHNTAGAVVIRKGSDTTDTYSATNIDTRDSVSSATAGAIRLSCVGTAVDIDDYFANDNAGATPITYPGDLHALRLTPTADTVDKDFTPVPSGADNYPRSAEEGFDADDTVVQATTTALDLYDITDVSGTLSVVGVNVRGAMRADEAGGSGYIQITSGVTNDNTGEVEFPTTYSYQQKFLTQDPATVAGWTLAGINALKLGPAAFFVAIEPPVPLLPLQILTAWNIMPDLTFSSDDSLWLCPLNTSSSPVQVDATFTTAPYYNADDIVASSINCKYAFTYNGRIYFVHTNSGVDIALILHSYPEDDPTDHTSLNIEALPDIPGGIIADGITSATAFALDSTNGLLYIGCSNLGVSNLFCGIIELDLSDNSTRTKQFGLTVSHMGALLLYEDHIYVAWYPGAGSFSGIQKLDLTDFTTVTTVIDYADDDNYGHWGAARSGTNAYFGPINTIFTGGNIVRIVNLLDDTMSTFDITTGNPDVVSAMAPWGLPTFGVRPYVDSTHLYIFALDSSSDVFRHHNALLIRFKLLDNSPDGVFAFEDVLGDWDSFDVWSARTDGTYHYVTVSVNQTSPLIENSLRVVRITQDLSSGEVFSLDTPPASNDAFADAIPLTLNSSLDGHNYYATHEASEPDHAGAGGLLSAWWTFTPTEDATVYVSVGTAEANAVAVYTGSSLGSLVEVVSDPVGLGVSFAAVTSTVYHIAVDNLFSGGAFYITAYTVPENDNWADALPVAVGQAKIGHILGATSEIDEPNPGGDGGGTSVWWKFVAPATGNYHIDMTGSEEYWGWALAVYTGTAVDDLVLIANDVDYPVADVTFAATIGTTYYIQFDADGAGSDVVGSIYFVITAV